MLDFLGWFIQQFFNAFLFLDSLIVFNTLSLLKILIIVFVFVFLVSIISKGGKK